MKLYEDHNQEIYLVAHSGDVETPPSLATLSASSLSPSRLSNRYMAYNVYTVVALSSVTISFGQ